jgi:hypothetical protein
MTTRTKHYHRPLSREDEASTLIFNQRFSQLDRAIKNFVTATGNRLTGTAGENIADRDAIFLDPTDNLIYRLDADVATPNVAVIRGFADGAALVTAGVTMVLFGVLDGFSSLTPWQAVYADITAGDITQTKPEPVSGGSQLVIAEMGFAISATEVFVAPKLLRFEMRDAMALNDTLTVMHGADDIGYQRRPLAYFNEVVTGASIESYASSNQDENVPLAGQSYAGSVTSSSATGGSAPLGDSGGIEHQQAQAFQLTSGGRLSQFTFALLANSGSPVGDLNWEIRADNATNPTGTVLASGTILNANVTPSATNTVNVSNGPILQASTTYWLRLIPASAQSSNVRWNWSKNATNPYAAGALKYSTNGGSSWSFFDAMDDAVFSVTASAESPYDKLAQTFTLSGTETIAEVGLWLKKVGSPTGTATLRIETVSGGNPTGTLADANATGTFAESSLITSYSEKTVSFANPVSLGAGTYALVLSTSRGGSATDYIDWGADGSSPSYAGGEMKGYLSAAWENLSKDAIFDIREASIYHPQKLKIDRWSGTHADMVNRYGDVAGADADIQTTFKCTKAAGFADVTVIVELY